MQIENRQARVAAFDQFEAELKELSERSRDKSRLITVFLKSKSKGEAVADLIGDVLIALMLPALRQAQAAEERSIQGHRNLRVAFALAAYRSENLSTNGPTRAIYSTVSASTAKTTTADGTQTSRLVTTSVCGCQ